MLDSINGNGYSSASMAQMRQEMFNKIDQNGDGLLSKPELESLSGKNGSRIDEFISKLDTNSDSAINQQEFEAGLAKLHQEMKSQSGADTSAPPPPPPPSSSGGSGNGSSGIFDSLDANKDGFVNADELAAADVPDADKILDEIDTDEDGKISKSESDTFEKKMKGYGPNELLQTNGIDGMQSMQTQFLSRMIDMISRSGSSELSSGEN